MVVVVVVLTLTRIIKSVVTGQAPVTLELRNTPGKNTTYGWYVLLNLFCWRERLIHVSFPMIDAHQNNDQMIYRCMISQAAREARARKNTICEGGRHKRPMIWCN